MNFSWCLLSILKYTLETIQGWTQKHYWRLIEQSLILVVSKLRIYWHYKVEIYGNEYQWAWNNLAYCLDIVLTRSWATLLFFWCGLACILACKSMMHCKLLVLQCIFLIVGCIIFFLQFNNLELIVSYI